MGLESIVITRLAESVSRRCRDGHRPTELGYAEVVQCLNSYGETRS